MKAGFRWQASVGLALLVFLGMGRFDHVLGSIVSGGAPGPRGLYFKLPLSEPRFHWNFLDREALLGGRLDVEVHGASGRDTVLTVFEDGAFAPGWKAIESDRGEGEIYFGFVADLEVWTEAHDSVVVRLVASDDLDGVGRYRRGVLSAGQYEAVGSYRTLTGHSPLGRYAPGLQRKEPTAYIGCWRAKWKQEITEEAGWAGRLEADSDQVPTAWWAELLPSVFSNRGTDGFRCVD